MQLRGTELTWHEVGDDVVALDLATSMYLRVNGTGKVLWERLASSSTEPELVEALRERFGITDERASADVAEFLDTLRERALLVE